MSNDKHLHACVCRMVSNEFPAITLMDGHAWSKAPMAARSNVSVMKICERASILLTSSSPVKHAEQADGMSQGCLGLATVHAELVHEARIGAQMPIHQNLMKPLALLYADAACCHLAGIVYPLMEGRDVFHLMR